MGNYSTPVIRSSGGGGGTVNRITFNGVEVLPDPSGNVTLVGFSGSYADLTDKPTLFSGNYADLVGKPVIPEAQVSSDWNATTGVAQILNKPVIPTVPTNVSAFTNDAGYLDSLDVAPVAISGSYVDLVNKPDLSPLATAIQNAAHVGTGTGLFVDKEGTNLRFRTLVAGDNVTIATSATGEIVISSVGGSAEAAGESNTSSSLGTGVSIVAPKNGVDLPFRSLLSSAGLSWSQETDTVTISLHAILQAWANLTLAADTLVYATGAGTLGTTPLTAFARTLLDDANAAAMQNTLSLALVASTGKYADLDGKPDIAGTAQAVVNGYGIGKYKDLRGTIYETGLPTDLYGKGTVIGFAAAGPLGITAVGTTEYGVLTVHGQWIDNSGAAGAAWREFRTIDNRIFNQHQVGNAWGGWTEVWHTGNLVKQWNLVDTTPGRLLLNGAHGLGAASLPDYSNQNFEAPPQATGWFMGSNMTPLPTANNSWYLVEQLTHNGSWITQKATGMAGEDGRIFQRQKNNGNWIGWREIPTTIVGTVNHVFHSRGTTDNGDVWNGSIELRESGQLTNTVIANWVAPGITFHWGAVYAARLFMGASGRLNWNGNGMVVNGAIDATSDRKFKKNIKKHKLSVAKERLMKLVTRTFFFTIPNKDSTGFIAQEVQKIYPNSVSRTEKGKKGHLVMNKDEIIADLVVLVQDQQKRLDKLEAKLNGLT